MYSAYKAFLLLESFQSNNKITFDLYIKMRSDLAFLNTINVDSFNSQSIYVKNSFHWRPTTSFVNDYIYFTKNYDALQTISKMGFSTDIILANPNSFVCEKIVAKDIYCPEEMLAKHIFNNKIDVRAYDFNIDLARYHI